MSAAVALVVATGLAVADDRPPTKLPKGWAGDPRWASADTTLPHGGKACLRVSAWGRPPGYAWVASDKCAVKAGAEYRLAGWVKSAGTTDGDDFLCIRWYKDGKYLSQFGPPIPADQKDWAEAEATAFPPAGATHLDVATFVRSKAGTVWLDDLSLTVVGDETELLVNGGFEPVNKH
jgi:hypothetical protein